MKHLKFDKDCEDNTFAKPMRSFSTLRYNERRSESVKSVRRIELARRDAKRRIDNNESNMMLADSVSGSIQSGDSAHSNSDNSNETSSEADKVFVPKTPRSHEDLYRGLERTANSLNRAMSRLRAMSVDRIRQVSPSSSVVASHQHSMSSNASTMQYIAKTSTSMSPSTPIQSQMRVMTMRSKSPIIEIRNKEDRGSVNHTRLRIELITFTGNDKHKKRYIYRQARSFVSVWDVLCK